MNPLPTNDRVEIEIDGLSSMVQSDHGDTVLGALLRAGCGIPYECSVGGCGSCKFTLLSGSVSEDIAESKGLRATERIRGKRLACVSRAITNCRIAVRLDPLYEPAVRPRRISATYVRSTAITHDISEFVFRSNCEANFLPGQYAKVLLPGMTMPRNYSMCNTANQAGQWHFQVKRVSGGQASRILFEEIGVGSAVEIDAPYSVAHLQEASNRAVICIAGGSGIAPMISILRGLADRPSRPEKPMLYYGARTQMDVVAPTYFRDIPGFDAESQYIPVVSEPLAQVPWDGATGWLHEHLAKHLPIDAGERDFYIAGPPPMVDAVRRTLALEKGVPVERLHYDRFY